MTQTTTPIKVISSRIGAGHYTLTVQGEDFTLLGPDPCYVSAPGYEWTLEGDGVQESFGRKRDAIEWLAEVYATKATQAPQLSYYWHNGNLREDGDCALRALEHVTGIGYKLSQKRALEYGYRRGEGMTIVELGLCLEAVEGKEAQFVGGRVLRQTPTVSEFAAGYTGKWILWVAKHVIGLVNGRLDGETGYENEPIIAVMGWGTRR